MMLFKEQHGGEQVQGIVWSFFVEPDQVVEQFVVKGVDVLQEQVFVQFDELFLDGAVKAFGICVHFGAFGVGQPAHSAVIQDDWGQSCLEFSPVI